MTQKYADSILPNLTIKEATELQFKLLDNVTKVFKYNSFFETGDVGLHPEHNRPKTTALVEQVLSATFNTEACALVRGSGTGAIRIALSKVVQPGDSVIVHTAPMYTTTKDTFHLMGLKQNPVNFNDEQQLRTVLEADRSSKVFYIQHARQQPTDTYSIKGVIQKVKTLRPELCVIVDDNYCAMKMKGIGVEYGADVSTFSGFKLLGPEGIGIILGSTSLIEKIHLQNYSGGGQVQGHEAHELLRSMAFAPVMLAIQNEQVELLCDRLNKNELPFVKEAYITNSQSKNVILELEIPIAQEVIAKASAHGAATYPVGAESKYELLPMIYRVSGSFIESNPELKNFGIRINPMKSSADTIIRILKEVFAEIRG
ncbi:aminotransferase class V-fold PLP-dependent enzyme [Fictibacillus sp. JL2B1089]|uniref:aminotransferase class V-fold PLP-dependent enzyme n=1 Tax=Fictibacillus sp. JL2B1089 TaxID=3399565 RepID=UPI003A8B54FD